MSHNPPSTPGPQDGGRAEDEPTRALGGEDTTSGGASPDHTTPAGEQPTQVFGTAGAPGSPDGGSSPYGGAPPPGGAPYAGSPYDGATPYGSGDAAAPTPTGSTYSRTTYTTGGEGDDGSSRGKGFVAAIVVGALVLLAAIAFGAMALFGGEEDPAADPTPTAPVTSEPTATGEATETPSETATATEEPTSTEATTEPSPTATAAGDLLRQLDESVVAGDATFTVTEAGFVPAPQVVEAGAVEAYTGSFTDGTNTIELLAAAFPTSEGADTYAAQLQTALEGAEQVATGETYANGMGTYWAYLVGEDRGVYLWTTDRGEVLQVTGPTDWVGPFYSGFSI